MGLIDIIKPTMSSILSSSDNKAQQQKEKILWYTKNIYKTRGYWVISKFATSAICKRVRRFKKSYFTLNVAAATVIISRSVDEFLLLLTSPDSQKEIHTKCLGSILWFFAVGFSTCDRRN